MTLYKNLVKKVSIPSGKKTKQSDYQREGLLKVVDQGHSLISGYTNDLSMQVMCELPVIVFGDHTRAVKYIDFTFAAGADGIKVLQPKDGILPKYLYYGTQFLVLGMENHGYARHYQYLEKKTLSIPEMPEQNRIVSRIEELFSDLDKAVETLQNIKQQLAVYRQAVLKEAFVRIKVYTEFSKLANISLGKMLDKQKNSGTPIKYLRNINVRWFSFDLSDVYEMKIEEEDIEKHSIQKDDLVICEGGEPGRCAVWERDEKIVYQKALHRVKFNRVVNPKYYMYFLWFAAQTGKLNSYFTGSGIKHLTKQSLSRFPVPECSKELQDIVVEDIESRLLVCENIEQSLIFSYKQANAIRQSILKTAFEGI